MPERQRSMSLYIDSFLQVDIHHRSCTCAPVHVLSGCWAIQTHFFGDSQLILLGHSATSTCATVLLCLILVAIHADDFELYLFHVQKCDDCGQVKPHADFQWDKRYPKSVRPRCKPCQLEYKRLQRQVFASDQAPLVDSKVHSSAVLASLDAALICLHSFMHVSQTAGDAQAVRLHKLCDAS